MRTPSSQGCQIVPRASFTGAPAPRGEGKGWGGDGEEKSGEGRARAERGERGGRKGEFRVLHHRHLPIFALCIIAKASLVLHFPLRGRNALQIRKGNSCTAKGSGGGFITLQEKGSRSKSPVCSAGPASQPCHIWGSGREIEIRNCRFSCYFSGEI